MITKKASETERRNNRNKKSIAKIWRSYILHQTGMVLEIFIIDKVMDIKLYAKHMLNRTVRTYFRYLWHALLTSNGLFEFLMAFLNCIYSKFPYFFVALNCPKFTNICPFYSYHTFLNYGMYVCMYVCMDIYI